MNVLKLKLDVLTEIARARENGATAGLELQEFKKGVAGLGLDLDGIDRALDALIVAITHINAARRLLHGNAPCA